MNRDEKIAGLKKLVGSLEAFAAHCLYVSDKKGAKTPFVFNEAQRRIHEMLEAQLKETGRVRAIVLKARQMGISTYIAGRLYHKVTTQRGKKALIVGHEQKSTDSLYGMVKYFQQHNPLGLSLGSTNAKELVFDLLGSGYRTATAGTQDVGRGSTSQYGHLSEFAYWPEGQKQLAGLGNTIADIPGTEIIIESTARGIGNAFHQLWQDAEAGKNDWLPVFLPWYIMPEYRAKPKPDLDLSLQDLEYQATYGLDIEQMQWRANKLSTYGSGYEYLWYAEYPACAAEAFAMPSGNALISANAVMAAVNSDYREFQGPLLIGCDPAGDGAADADRTAIAFRQGRICKRLEYHSGLDTMQIAGKLAQYHQQHKPAAIFVDKGGLGAGVFDRLRELGVPVIGVNSATKANDAERFENKRAEMWWLMRDWLTDAPCRIPKNMALVGDLTSPQPKTSSNGRRLLEKKEDMKKRGLRSPDGADALALTFAQPVASREAIEYRIHRPTKPAGKAGY